MEITQTLKVVMVASVSSPRGRWWVGAGGVTSVGPSPPGAAAAAAAAAGLQTPGSLQTTAGP